MSTFFAYIGITLLVLKGLAPFFGASSQGSSKESIDRALGFSEDSKNPII